MESQQGLIIDIIKDWLLQLLIAAVTYLFICLNFMQQKSTKAALMP